MQQESATGAGAPIEQAAADQVLPATGQETVSETVAVEQPGAPAEAAVDSDGQIIDAALAVDGEAQVPVLAAGCNCAAASLVGDSVGSLFSLPGPTYRVVGAGIELPGAGPTLNAAGPAPRWNINFGANTIRIDFLESVATYGGFLAFTSLDPMLANCPPAMIAGIVVTTNHPTTPFNVITAVTFGPHNVKVPLAGTSNEDWKKGEYIEIRLQYRCEPCSGEIKVLTGGIEDAFGTAADPAPVWSPNLTAYWATPSNKPTTGFDSTSANAWFGHSFRIDACKVCSAKLEMQVRQNQAWGTTSTKNDSLHVGGANFGLPWQRVQANLYLWPVTAPQPTIKPLTYNLSPQAFNTFIANYNSPNYMQPWLDVVVQDDTAVDFVRLTLQY